MADRFRFGRMSYDCGQASAAARHDNRSQIFARLPIVLAEAECLLGQLGTRRLQIRLGRADRAQTYRPGPPGKGQFRNRFAPSAQLPLSDNDFSGSPQPTPTSSQRNTSGPAGRRRLVPVVRTRSRSLGRRFPNGVCAGFRTLAMTRPRRAPSRCTGAVYPPRRSHRRR
jgi:hypothetical protein